MLTWQPPARLPSSLARYGFAVGSFSAALFLTLLLHSSVERSTFVFFSGAVVLSAWYGGLSPGLVTAALGVLAADYFLIPPVASFAPLDPRDLVPLGVLGFMAVLTGSLTHSLRAAYYQAEVRGAELRELSAKAEAANRAKADFLAWMSHEVRTPLNAIIGYADLLQLGIRGPVTPSQAQDLERIRRGGGTS